MSEPVVRCEGVSVRFGVTVALDRVDIEIPSGRVVGIAGADGAGKTTLVASQSGSWQLMRDGYPYSDMTSQSI